MRTILLALTLALAVPAHAQETIKHLTGSSKVGELTAVLDLLQQFPSVRPEPYEFVTALNPLQPRLYSISSSLKAHPDQVHLTVGIVRSLRSVRHPSSFITHWTDPPYTAV